jgi:hypothetical protein
MFMVSGLDCRLRRIQETTDRTVACLRERNISFSRKPDTHSICPSELQSHKYRRIQATWIPHFIYLLASQQPGDTNSSRPSSNQDNSKEDVTAIVSCFCHSFVYAEHDQVRLRQIWKQASQQTPHSAPFVGFVVRRK